MILEDRRGIVTGCGPGVAGLISKPVSICLLSIICTLIILFLPTPGNAGHWDVPTPTPYVASFAGIFKINNLPAQPGDEVAFFDPQGVLCGLFIVNTSGQYGAVSIYGDDPLSAQKDEGASPDDILIIKIWDSRAGVELEGGSLILSPGVNTGSFVSSPIPPVWQDKVSYILDINTASHYIPPNPVFYGACDYYGNITIEGVPAEIGDEIAVFTPGGMLVGHARVTIPGKFGIMHIYGDDVNTSSIEGARSGENLTFNVWDKSAGIEYVMQNIIFTPGLPVGSFIPSSNPPIWTENTNYVLDINISKNNAIQYKIDLNKGWNFISIPVQPVDTSIIQVLKDISSSVYIVWSYDNEQKVWLKYLPNAQNSTLKKIVPGAGYWVFMSTDSRITITGTDASPVVQLYEGWNLTGYNGVDNAGFETKLSTLNDKWSIAWNWQNGIWRLNRNSADTILSMIFSYSTLTKLNRGKAYWIKIKPGTGVVNWIQ